MNYLVHGASGAQGSPVCKALLARGHHVLGAVRHVDQVPPGVKGVTVDLGDVNTLKDAYAQVDGVFVHLPLGGADELVTYATNVIAAVEAVRPSRVVVSTSGRVIDRPDLCLQSPPESAIQVLLEGLGKSGISVAVIATRLYLENLLLPVVQDDVQAEGVLHYPVPATLRVSWCSHLDVADVAVRLFDSPAVEGVVGLGHLPGLTGEDLATGFSEHLGKPVFYEAITPEAFGKRLEPVFGPESAHAVTLMYKAIGANTDNELVRRTAAQNVLGYTPRSVATWLREM
ncbi:SDR family oxidoreductase [Stomatohabitans albus]|uniref:SDR family oxidoreductase n=1 Tax=Stomatohabitans albus TaxID=3110766 RepID=UPI00300CE2DB